PTYKRAETLLVTINSVLAQVGDINYELLIVNNSSAEEAEETREIIKKIASEKIFYYENRENIGLCGNWNMGVELARSEYVAMIHDDDLLSPYFLKSVLTAIEKNNKPGIIGVDYYNFNTDNMPEFTAASDLTYRKLTKKSFFFGRNINIAGMTVRKDLFYEIGGYSEDYYPNEDTNLIYQALLKDSVININHPLAGYRKECNLSLADGTMKKIIITMENTRRNIALHEKFAENWMKMFDREFLYMYIIGANKTWNLDIDYTEIFDYFKLRSSKPVWLKIIIMKLLIKFILFKE
ncbi:MAG: glycosyltransferase family 2 protein, partial [Oscillospiraceae bacterium]|nr:glycosyltransferase family 2 protein [Oscillospiraceae bacterium]